MKEERMLNQALKLLRKFEGLSLTETASRLDISKAYLSELENGHKPPTLKVITKYSEEFNIPVSSILFFSEELDKGEGKFAKKTRHYLSGKILKVMEYFSDD